MENEKALRASIVTLNKCKNSRSINVLFLIVPAFILMANLVDDFINDTYIYSRSELKENIVLGLIVGLIIGAILVLAMHGYCDYRISICNSKLIMLGIEDAKEDVDNDIYKNLIKISYKYLDEYYLQTRQQAQKGFVVTVAVAIMGAIVIAIGIGAMFLGKTTPAYVTTASGVLTEFIATIFFYLYNRTISSMSDYHNKLVLSQNVSIALKIAESLSDESGEKVKEHIVEELMKDINIHIHSEESVSLGADRVSN